MDFSLSSIRISSSVITWLPLAAALLIEVTLEGRASSLARIVRLETSVRRDLMYWAMYMSGLASVLVVFTPPGSVAHFLNAFFQSLFSVGQWLRSGAGGVAVSALVGLLCLDLAHYWAHRAMHRWPLLWKFHAIHHSAKEMCLFTGARVSLTEKGVSDLMAFFFLKSLGLAVGGIAAALLVRRFIDIVQHSNVGWTYGRLGFLFASPVNHRLHHALAKEDWNSNYGNILSIWDHIFGTANPKMIEMNRHTVTVQRCPIGLPLGEEPFGTGWRSLPVVQDIFIWWTLFSTAFRRANAAVGSGQRYECDPLKQKAVSDIFFNASAESPHSRTQRPEQQQQSRSQEAKLGDPSVRRDQTVRHQGKSAPDFDHGEQGPERVRF